MKNKVLICDDEYLIRQGIEFMLDWEKEGFEVCGKAANGKQALELIEKLKPDLVISDIVMPEMDGVELTRIIKERWPEIQVIILSSYSEFDYVRSTLTNGAADYILKPALSPEILKNSLDKVRASMNSTRSDKKTDYGPLLSRICAGSKEKAPDLSGEFVLFCTAEGSLNPECFSGSKILCRLSLPERYEGMLIQASSAEKEFEENRYRMESQESNSLVLARTLSNLSELDDLFEREIRPVAAERFYLKRPELIRLPRPAVQSASAVFSQAEYSRNLESGQYSQAFDLLRNWLKKAALSYTPESEVKSTVSGAIYTFIGFLEDSLLNEEQVRHFKLNCFSLAQSARNMEALQENLEAMIQDFQIIMESYQVEESRREIQAIMDYIRQHLSEPLQLQDIADQFGFSYSYLSSLISNASSETFTEYLNRIRIEQACRLLQSTNKSISEIALACGYSDSGYFSRIFRKLMGKSPRQYRNLSRC